MTRQQTCSTSKSDQFFYDVPCRIPTPQSPIKEAGLFKKSLLINPGKFRLDCRDVTFVLSAPICALCKLLVY
jgi:hypothetical protein